MDLIWLTFFLNMARIESIVLDPLEQPKQATIVTHLGPIKVEWHQVCGDMFWVAYGSESAKKLAVPAIERIERMISTQ